MMFNAVTKGVDLVTKRNTKSEYWGYAVRNRMESSEDDLMRSITMPLSQEDVLKSKERFVYKRQPSKIKRKKEKSK